MQNHGPYNCLYIISTLGRKCEGSSSSIVVQHDCNYTSTTATFVSHILASMSAKPTSYNLSVKLLVVGAGTI